MELNIAKITTPWGDAERAEHIAEGIISITTASHGGILISTWRRDAMPPVLRDFEVCGNWYEEDCNWSLVALSFPDEFEPEEVERAYRIVEVWKPDLLAELWRTNPELASVHAAARST